MRSHLLFVCVKELKYLCVRECEVREGVCVRKCVFVCVCVCEREREIDNVR